MLKRDPPARCPGPDGGLGWSCSCTFKYTSPGFPGGGEQHLFPRGITLAHTGSLSLRKQHFQARLPSAHNPRPPSGTTGLRLFFKSPHPVTPAICHTTCALCRTPHRYTPTLYTARRAVPRERTPPVSWLHSCLSLSGCLHPPTPHVHMF